MPRRFFTCCLCGLLACLAWPAAVLAQAEPLRVAAAADLKYALDQVVAAFQSARPDRRVDVTYGSSGKFSTQIRQGAPFDLFFSADVVFPRELVADGHAVAPVTLYARGRLVLWTPGRESATLDLSVLTQPGIQRIAMANPRHAPYGKRAEEALRAAGLWETVQSRLVFGENIAQATQFVQSGNAQAGLIALSLVMVPGVADARHYRLLPETLHAPLDQGYVLTRRGQNNVNAREFAEFVRSPGAQAILSRFGFVSPLSPAGRP